jgi:ADP-ribose pyrophosphatase
VPELLASRIVHEGRRIRVRLDRVRLPDGGEKRFDVIEHPGAVAIVPLLPDGRIVLMRQWRHVVGRWLTEIPAGTLEPGEAPVDCARREVREETGYEAREMLPLVAFHTTPGIAQELMHCFVARGLTHTGADPDLGELIELVEVGCAEALAMCLDGRLADGKSIAALLAAERAGLLAWNDEARG